MALGLCTKRLQAVRKNYVSGLPLAGTQRCMHVPVELHAAVRTARDVAGANPPMGRKRISCMQGATSAQPGNLKMAYGMGRG